MIHYHADHTKECFELYGKQDNKLRRSLYFWSQDDLARAEVRTLGIMNKLYTGPLWRKINSVTRIEDTASVLRDFARKHDFNPSGLFNGECPLEESYVTKEDGEYERLPKIEEDPLFVLANNSKDLTANILKVLCSACANVLVR